MYHSGVWSAAFCYLRPKKRSIEVAITLDFKERNRLDHENPLFRSLRFGTLLANQLGKAKIAQGTAAFVTSGLTLAITPTTLLGTGITTVYSVQITPITDNAAYKASAAAGGVVTVTRPGSGTSAATFNYLIIGE